MKLYFSKKPFSTTGFIPLVWVPHRKAHESKDCPGLKRAKEIFVFNDKKWEYDYLPCKICCEGD